MLKFLHEDWFRGVLYTVLAIGTAALIFAAWQYISAAQQLQNNIAQQLQSETGITLESVDEARGLMAADLERRDLAQQQFQAMMTGGAGLVIISLGWLTLNYLRQRTVRTKG